MLDYVNPTKYQPVSSILQAVGYNTGHNEAENPVFRAMVSKLGKNYSVESHQVPSKDGFVLKLFRVVGNGTEAPRY